MYHFVRLALVKPGYLINMGMPYLRLIKIAERVNFPNFPLAITSSQAKQMAALLEPMIYSDVSVDELAQALQGKLILMNLALWLRCC